MPEAPNGVKKLPKRALSCPEGAFLNAEHMALLRHVDTAMQVPAPRLFEPWSLSRSDQERPASLTSLAFSSQLKHPLHSMQHVHSYWSAVALNGMLELDDGLVWRGNVPCIPW